MFELKKMEEIYRQWDELIIKTITETNILHKLCDEEVTWVQSNEIESESEYNNSAREKLTALRRYFISDKAIQMHDVKTPYYRCFICKTEYAALKKLRRHISIVHITKNNKCNMCRKSFRKTSNFNFHLLSQHTNGARYRCEKCPRKFFTKSHLIKHNLKLKCENCNISFCNDLSCKKDIKCHTENENGVEKHYRCFTCNTEFALLKELTEHLHTHISENNKCNICRKTFSKYCYLNLHLLSKHTNGALYQCKHCLQKFVCGSKLYKHIRNIQQCDICNATLCRSVEYKNHMKQHKIRQSILTTNDQSIENRSKIPEALFHCAQCPRRLFRSKRTLKSHINVVHLKLYPYNCKFCSKKFSCTMNVKRHILNHHKDISAKQ